MKFTGGVRITLTSTATLAVRDGVAAGEGAVEALLDDEWDDLGGRAVVQPALLEFSLVVDAAGGVGRRVAQLH
jgi:hypothetical protein